MAHPRHIPLAMRTLPFNEKIVSVVYQTLPIIALIEAYFIRRTVYL
jgi:hypothetical protein